MAKKAKVFVGETGNKAEVTEERRDAKTEPAKHARELVGMAGSIFTPIGYDYIGSATVFFYSKPSLVGKDFVYACQTDVSMVDEAIGDIGWKGLRDALMQAYGREKPKTRE